MPAEPSTLAALRRAGIVSSQEIVAAIDAYMRDPAVGPYRFASGHTLDIPALVGTTLDRVEFTGQPGPQEKAYRTKVAAIIIAASPRLP
jgi:hypothetical protein